MNILLVYPKTPQTFYSFNNALRFISKKSAEPPLGLLTVAAMLPAEWQKKLIDINVTPLKDEHILWADYVFLSGMNVHIESFKKVIKRCNQLGVKIIAGGPLATTEQEQFLGVDHFILNEAEITLPMFLRDLENRNPQKIYQSDQFPDITNTPVPMWELLEKNKYASMSVQYSRGCPYNCEFCSITMLNGRNPRVKSKSQFLNELEILYKSGWRGGVFVVDDNFIGNKKILKSELLPALKIWSQQRNYPFHFYTEVSINLADDEQLIKLLVEAGFNHTFVGIETPVDESLAECGKFQNRKRDMVESVKKLQRKGLMVSGGFIVGFDNDPPTIFERQISFIQKSGIVTAMVGLLNAPTGTRLFDRLKSEKRLLKLFTGNNMDGSINFIPAMNYQKLIKGYKNILETIYSPKNYYERVKTFLHEYKIPIKKPVRINFDQIKALLRSCWILGILDDGKRYFWKLFFLGLFKHPAKFPVAITLAIYGFHFRKIVDSV